MIPYKFMCRNNKKKNKAGRGIPLSADLPLLHILAAPLSSNVILISHLMAVLANCLLRGTSILLYRLLCRFYYCAAVKVLMSNCSYIFISQTCAVWI